jgi:hypothetical protein
MLMIRLCGRGTGRPQSTGGELTDWSRRAISVFRPSPRAVPSLITLLAVVSKGLLPGKAPTVALDDVDSHYKQAEA